MRLVSKQNIGISSWVFLFQKNVKNNYASDFKQKTNFLKVQLDFPKRQIFQHEEKKHKAWNLFKVYQKRLNCFYIPGSKQKKFHEEPVWNEIDWFLYKKEWNTQCTEKYESF